jgi:hypothetical protein
MAQRSLSSSTTVNTTIVSWRSQWSVGADERRVRQFEGRSDRGDIAAALT